MSSSHLTRGFRHSLKRIVPVWLQNRPGLRIGYQFLYTCAAICDIAANVIVQGVRAGWPGVDGRTDNLPYIGFSRSLVQGESESAANFQARLRAWLSTHELRGDEGELAREIHLYLGNNPMVRVWTRNGNCTTCAADGTITREYAVAGGWSGTGLFSGLGLNWDSISNPERANYWQDAWIVIYPTEFAKQPVINGSPRTGVIPQYDPLREEGIGHDCSRVQRDVVLGLIDTWRGGHTVVRLVVWSYDSTLFDPANPTASGNPDGLWGRGSFFGACPAGTVGSGQGLWPSRNRDCRYWVPPLN